MSRPRFEREERSPIQPNGGIIPREPMSLASRLAHLYDATPRKAVVLGNRDGEVIGGTGGNVRPATLAEVAHVLNGGTHAPLDARSLIVPGKKLTHRERVQTGLQGQIDSGPQMPFEVDYRNLKAAREARKAAAKVLKSKGNKGRKTA
ncbi:MAG: hypothetical protein KBD51_03550 [Candidatus Levybacteria bacterium]|nr:hypothetical protein [Candidatus Levybacteria bacterium]